MPTPNDRTTDLPENPETNPPFYEPDARAEAVIAAFRARLNIPVILARIEASVVEGQLHVLREVIAKGPLPSAERGELIKEGLRRCEDQQRAERAERARWVGERLTPEGRSVMLGRHARMEADERVLFEAELDAAAQELLCQLERAEAALAYDLDTLPETPPSHADGAPPHATATERCEDIERT